MKAITKRFLYVLLTAVLCIVAVICGQGNLSASADASTDSVQEIYESTNVLNNLKGATIGGKEFDLADYPHNSNGKPQVISFVEFCYSYYAEKQADYGLYVYVYNPQDVAFDMSSERNKIQFTYGEKLSYSKYVLEFINYSTEAGYEGRFWKFKVKLTDGQKTAILRELKEDNRIYKISGIELSYKSKITEYACGQTYTYKGYALGYGSELAQSDTLSCKVDGFDKYLSLDVRSTYYRPKGTYDDGYTRDTLHSVYFSVPNAIIDEYGEMTAVHATWLNALTNPIFVTGNKDIFNALSPFIGKYVNGGSKESYSSELGYALVATMAVEELRDSVDAAIAGYYAYNAYLSCYDGDNMYAQNYNNVINYLRYIFYADGGDADNYTLPASKLIGNKAEGVKGWFETYTEKYGGRLVNDRYSKDLFESIDTKFTDVTISSDDEYTLTDNTVSDTIWKRLFGGSVTDRKTYTMSAIQKVTTSDINSYSDKSLFCDKFYIAESDYTDFTNYVKSAASKKETVYLFRYNQSKYVSNEVTEYKRKTEWYLIGGNFGAYDVIDTNAYFAQTWVQLDFDIIDLTFTKDNVDTVIPVVMSPMDIVPDLNPPVSTVKDGGLKWWQILLGIIALTVIFLLLLKFAPGVVLVIGQILIFPFKCIGALFKAIGNSIKKRRQKREEKKREQTEKEIKAEKKRRQRLRERKRNQSEELPDGVWVDDLRAKPKCKHKQPKPPELKGNVKPEEVDAYLDSIDWDSVDWTKLDGKSG
ncbi:MAG: hypothetical protein NC114_08980 [Ruminococcus flavefaciens]|nr:hypothetical protein [Ruminococcus flavefaciens]